ncbi:MAG TPA: hypothetical protein VFL79_14760 [Terriglobia bacterium]|nr:hypothetical protein [Terriglobia bacterium]
MKTVRSLIVPVSMLVMLLGLAATGMKAQSLSSTHFVGKFTLPFAAEWGRMSLPPGDYNLYYGYMGTGGINIVEVAHQEPDILHGYVFVRGRGDAKGEGSFLTCVFEGDKGYVRSLQMAEISESIEFTRPHGVSVAAWIVAGNETHNTNARLAEMRIPLIPVR